MGVEENFIILSGLLCEPTRAKMLWNLLDGRAYTATELSTAADVSATSASNHLAKLLEAGLVKVEAQGRHRYYSFSKPGVAYVVESIAHLAGLDTPRKDENKLPVKGIRYCRSCYDHLAGYVGVKVAEALEAKGCIESDGTSYTVTAKGWEWLAGLDISRESLEKSRRPLIRPCLDWSERRPHLAGQLGALLLEKMLAKNYFKRVRFSRELIVTMKGRQELYERLGVVVS
ncbi:MAG: winged helix-turn-helix domain-containing protein [Cytophagales bacterium]|nr:winged helix-turn-helix domain-containing protein [Cytophagales bacterium]